MYQGVSVVWFELVLSLNKHKSFNMENGGQQNFQLIFKLLLAQFMHVGGCVAVRHMDLGKTFCLSDTTRVL